MCRKHHTKANGVAFPLRIIIPPKLESRLVTTSRLLYAHAHRQIQIGKSYLTGAAQILALTAIAAESTLPTPSTAKNRRLGPLVSSLQA